MSLAFLRRVFPAVLLFVLVPLPAAAAEIGETLHLVGSSVGFFALLTFAVAYGFVMGEEFVHIRKSKPVLLAATIIWAMIAVEAHAMTGVPEGFAEASFRSAFIEFAEIFFFLLVAMTFVNAMTERNVFEALRTWLVKKNMSFRAVFWITGVIAFFASPIIDNLTTALLMAAVAMAVGGGVTRFIVPACINIVVAANAGGAFSPFGDITTLMVWQRGVVEFTTFFALFIPAVVNYVVPAVILSFVVPRGVPETTMEDVELKTGALNVVGLFLVTITFTAFAHQEYDMPAVYGMLGGLSLLQLYSFFLQRRHGELHHGEMPGEIVSFDVFRTIARAEWDTLLFFYGVLLCVAGLATFGYLQFVSSFLYEAGDPTVANVILGILSAIVDNIPVMYSVLTMQPGMDLGQWLLITLTVGVGGSLLSIGSAAGVALMGQARGIYTFFGHLKWSWAIALGYGASILVHLWVNAAFFTEGL